jgi:hypothetical protein
MNMKHALGTILLVLLLLFTGDPVRGEPVEPEQRDAAIRKSIAWLDDHLLQLQDSAGTPRKPFTVATAGLVHLMAGKDGLTRSRSAVLPRIREYLLAYIDRVERRTADDSALPARPGVFSSDHEIQYTWALAQAGFFFAETYQRGQSRAESRKALVRITRLLEAAQQENGGWGHGRTSGITTPPETLPNGMRLPKLPAGGGYPNTLVAATSTAATTLGMIELALGRNTVKGLDRARDYFRQARLSNGNFPYDPSQRSAHRSKNGVARTGGALLAMYFLGFPADDPVLVKSLSFVTKKLVYVSEGHGSATLNFSQSALALRLLDDRTWLDFKTEYFPRIIEKQSTEGDIACVCRKKAFGTTCDSKDYGFSAGFMAGQQAYTTALNTFVLLLDTGRLEIIRKKPRPVARRATATEEPR